MTEQAYKKRVLIVEDHSDIAESIKDLLENKNYLVKIADTEKDAITLLRKMIFDAALVDLQLKDDTTHKGGIVVLKEINRLDEGVKAIVMTASSDIADAKASFDQNISGFLLKSDMKSKNIFDELDKLFKTQRRRSFGDFPSLHSYLAAPALTPIWEDSIFRHINCSFDNFQKTIWKSLSPHLPVLRMKDGRPSLLLADNNAVSGCFWSKGEGCALWFSAATNNDGLVRPPLELRPDDISSCATYAKIVSAVWRLNAVERREFLDYITDTPWETKPTK